MDEMQRLIDDMDKLIGEVRFLHKAIGWVLLGLAVGVAIGLLGG